MMLFKRSSIYEALLIKVILLDIMSELKIEICCFSLSDALAADHGGADRIELCTDPALGGVTPSLGLICVVNEVISIPTWVIVRPRGGGFVYDRHEKEIIIRDLDALSSIGIDGVVMGCLDSSGELDRNFIKSVLHLFPNLPLAFHKAIDVASNLTDTVQQLIDFGFVRVLTSGGASSVQKGLMQIIELEQRFGNQIEIMAGGGVRQDNLQALIQGGIRHLHTSLRTSDHSKEAFQTIRPDDVESFVKTARQALSSTL